MFRVPHVAAHWRSTAASRRLVDPAPTQPLQRTSLPSFQIYAPVQAVPFNPLKYHDPTLPSGVSRRLRGLITETGLSSSL